jgi:CheY-like chemotaxis protein
MVKQLAELHGGAVFVESSPGEGSRFTVWLPVRAWEADPQVPVPPPDLTPAAPRTRPPPGAPTALVVEDDAKSAELIRVQLEAEGFKVLHAANAERALVVAQQQPLSLITLDIMLPDMDGWEFLGRIKQVPALARIPVVIISIVASSTKGFALGASAIMQKPISRQELYEALVELGLFPLARGRSLKVLVADDDPKAVELTAVRVLGMASTVLKAYGGQQAIDIARRELPDLLVLDLMMPDVSGFDVVTKLQEQPETARIPILVVTAKHLTQEDRKKLSGFVRHIVEKSELDPERFSTEIRRAMSGRQQAA